MISNQSLVNFTILQIIFTLVSIVIYGILIVSVQRFNNYIYIYLFLGLQVISYAFNFVWFLQGIEKYRYAALATFISGSGSTLMAFCHKTMSQEIYEILTKECEKNNIKGKVKILSPIKEGAIKL